MTDHDTITVLVPDEHALDVLSPIAGVRPVRYDVEGELPAEAAEAEVLIPPFLAGKRAVPLVEKLPKLRLVQLLSAGAEVWLGRLPDGVALSTCRGAHGGSTAEWVVAVLLSFYRHLPFFLDAQRAGRWDYQVTDTLQDKRVLIVGAGDLGTQLVRRLEPFDVTTTVVGRTAREGVHGVDELPELLGTHDAVVLVVPLTSDTTGMVDAEFLSRMADGAILVNAARGPVVDTDALVAELRKGRIRAALDVTEPEPLPEDHPLWSVDGLLLTPHVAGSCTGREKRAYGVAAAEVARFVRGEEPRNLVRGEY
ncbi:2-hydroxyacid dehydrogenase [Kutzneria kofuensis]|uniref:Phosphoglycerate dehydrogenase-like enzyme n=1 Tax=Kutzneria kofuensis TaxID=103725 RepID=A0A7W9NJC3_9PSEU|nr:2-hydroxyacid dehydrogenase [Kutzneria kofuensis]MBB5894008.1 phosphoglycerate dehydrogenase-like enzyme [Kutzneria kofuensis]